MGIEKLIERLMGHKGALYELLYKKDMEDATTALSMLQAENEKLRADLRRLQTERDALLKANQHLLAERDADRKEDLP